MLDQAAATEEEAPNPSLAVVGVEVMAVQAGELGPPVDEATGDRTPVSMAVLDHRLDQPLGVAAGGAVAVGSFHAIPAEVEARLTHPHNVDLLPAVLADVGDVEQAV